MDRLDLFELISDAVPRLVAAVVVLSLLICPQFVSSVLISMARERGEEVAAELDRIVMPPQHRQPHGGAPDASGTVRRAGRSTSK